MKSKNGRHVLDVELMSQVESYVIDTIFFREKDESLSSGLIADDILEIVDKYLKGEKNTQKKPWEHFGIKR